MKSSLVKLIAQSPKEVVKYIADLETKVEKYEEKETPYKPINYYCGHECRCKCKVKKNYRRCPNCGQKLDWHMAEENIRDW